MILITLSLIYHQDFLFAISAIILFILSIIPLLMRRNYKVSLPWGLEFLIVIILLLHILGSYYNFFVNFRFYSPMMHFLGTALIAFLAYGIVYTLNMTKKIRLSHLMIGIFTLIFALAIGAIWEIGEFTLDQNLGTYSQGDGIDPLTDTMYDLIWDGVAGLFIAIVGQTWMKTYPQITNFFKKIFRKLKIFKPLNKI